MGALFVGTGEVDKAVAAYEQSVAQNAGNTDALVGKCRAEAESSKYSDISTLLAIRSFMNTCSPFSRFFAWLR